MSSLQCSEALRISFLLLLAGAIVYLARTRHCGAGECLDVNTRRVFVGANLAASGLRTGLRNVPGVNGVYLYYLAG